MKVMLAVMLYIVVVVAAVRWLHSLRRPECPYCGRALVEALYKGQPARACEECLFWELER